MAGKKTNSCSKGETKESAEIDATPKTTSELELARTIMFTPDLKDNRLTSDGRYWSAKPNTAETAAITRRMQRTSPLEVTPERFCKFVAMGGTWTGALFEPGNRKGWGGSGL